MHLEDVRNYDYINYAVRHDYSSPGHIDSTSTALHVQVPRLLAQARH
jgi:hypothetical protein